MSPPSEPTNSPIDIAEKALMEFLSVDIKEIVAIIGTTRDHTTSGEYLVRIPEGADVDLPSQEIDHLIAKTSNIYGRVARLAGIARAYAKLTKGKYERVYKSSKGTGSNIAEREAKAMQEALPEHKTMVMADAIAELASGLENAARVASESARKLKKATTAMEMAQQREDSYGNHRYGSD